MMAHFGRILRVKWMGYFKSYHYQFSFIFSITKHAHTRLTPYVLCEWSILSRSINNLSWITHYSLTCCMTSFWSLLSTTSCIWCIFSKNGLMFSQGDNYYQLHWTTNFRSVTCTSIIIKYIFFIFMEKRLLYKYIYHQYKSACW